MRLLWGALAIALALGGVGCSSSSQATGCHLIGCTSGATFDLGSHALLAGSGQSLTTCVDDHCTTRSAPDSVNLAGGTVVVPYGGERTVRVSITVRAHDGTILRSESARAHVRRVQPNGPDCAPTCYVARVHLTTDGRLAEDP